MVFNILILILTIIIIIFCIYFLTNYGNSITEFYTYYQYDKELILKDNRWDCKMDVMDKNGPLFIFWTGGYDSTFRICQALIDERRYVIPIYISAVIDNLEDKNTRRHNKEFEYEAMKKIRRIKMQSIKGAMSI